MIKYLQLPFLYDAARMLQETEELTTLWLPHFNKRDYEGNWSGLSLRSPGGAAGNLLTEHLSGTTTYEDTILLQQCPYISTVLQSVRCPQTSVRLLKLEKGAVIKEHTDAGLNFEEGEARLHIPVITHHEVAFYLDKERLDMKAGECWYINASLPHQLSNPSPVDRIHLVIDCVVNDWLSDWFNNPEIPVKSIKDISNQQYMQQLKVITELRRSTSPHHQQLADQMALDNNELLISCLVGFIRDIGIVVHFGPVGAGSFLPGISIEEGELTIDKDQLKYPGDMLHEAGHIAVVPIAERGTLNATVLGQRPHHAAEEMMAMAWSYAVCKHLNLDPHVVFHADGYKGGSDSLLQSFTSTMPLGTPMLQYVGMTWTRDFALEKGVAPYPAMLRWVRE